jgi:putative endonuclease
MHFIYIIYSEKLDRFYIGETVDILNRIDQHNSGFFKKSSTSIAKDWKLSKFFTVNNRIEGRKVEGYIKRMKSKIFLKKLIENDTFYIEFKNLVKEKFGIHIQN